MAQLVRAPPCHGGGRGFEPHPGRHLFFASVAQLVEQRTENPRVVGSIPTGGTTCGFSSFGRASPCQGEGGGFEPRNPLQKYWYESSYPLTLASELRSKLSFLILTSKKIRARVSCPLFLERITGIEPATSTLARSRSTK